MNPVQWPDGADGDVFRRLASRGFDFSVSRGIDFNVDFESWPPHPDAIRKLRERYEDLSTYAPSDGRLGYVLFKIAAALDYGLVTETQERVTSAMSPYGGVCESWGVQS